MLLNVRAILRALSYIIGIVALALIPSVLCALYYQEYGSLRALAVTLAISLLLTLLFRHFSQGRQASTLRVRDGYLAVSLSWFLCSLVGALPYLLSGETSSVMDALFESTSGFTTTGATVMVDWDLPRSIVLWRATTNWLGGMTILVFIISVLPRFGAGLIECGLAVVEQVLQLVLKLVGEAAEIAPLGGVNVLEPLHDFRQQALAAEVLDADGLESGSIGRAGRFRHRRFLQSFELTEIHDRTFPTFGKPGLEFSKDWKNRGLFFQPLEKRLATFQGLEK